MHRFFQSPLPKETAQTTLSADESHHLVHVLRVKEGETVTLVDGKGGRATAEIVKASARGAIATILSVAQEKASTRIHLVFAVSKGPALDFIVRRCTEVGIASLQPIVTAHSSPKNAWNEERWEKVVHEVGKQCQSAWFPTLCPPLSLDSWLTSRERSRLFFYCDENERRAPLGQAGSVDCDIVVGAEGGWNREEIEKMAKADGKALGLGANRLRAETAALVATVLVKAMLLEL